MSRFSRIVCLCVLLLAAAIQPTRAQETFSLQPFQRSLSAQAVTGTYQYSAVLSIPRGKRLVVEYVSVRVVSSDPTDAIIVNDVTLTTTVQGATVKHSLANPQRNGSFYFWSGDPFVLGQQVKFYADGGTQVLAGIELAFMGDGQRQNASIEWVISGYLIG